MLFQHSALANNKIFIESKIIVVKNMDDKNVSYEPMDIDLSSHSVSAMDISYVERSFECSPVVIKQEKEDCFTEKCLNIKPLTINNLIENHAQNCFRRQAYSKQILKLVICITVSIFAMFTYQVANFKCYENLNINSLRKTFTTKIYGQTMAAETLIKALESEESNKIVTLYGGTGVGKTFMASLMLENILQYGNVYHYTMPGFSQTSSDFMLGLVYCESSIIVVDDLNRNDILNVKDHITDLIAKSIKYSKKITILLLYNCDTMGEQSFRKCDDNFVQELKHSLTNIDAHKYLIKFESLTEQHLRKCIENELSNRAISEPDIINIMKNFNVTIDGCKGVYQKMKYLSIV